MYQLSDKLSALAAEVVNKHSDIAYLRSKLSRIAFLISDAAKKSNNKIVYAEATKVDDKTKAVAGIDFFVTFYSPNCKGIGAERMETLMHHELKHCGYRKGKPVIIPHDVEDFASIIKEHGIDWIK